MAHGDMPAASTPPLLPATAAQQRSAFQSLTLASILEDLTVRFILNLPAEELASMERLCFQIEQAHWYYEDFVRSNSAIDLPGFQLRSFAFAMFQSTDMLKPLLGQFDDIWVKFMKYKERVPVCGAILVSPDLDQVLLVRAWSKSGSWSFPRGKINKLETQANCAIREVLEETGFDIAPWFVGKAEEDLPKYVERTIHEQKIRLYFIPDVPLDTAFETQTRKEISKIDWFPLSELPTYNSGNAAIKKHYMVAPFVQSLREFVKNTKKSRKGKHKSRPATEPVATVVPSQQQRELPPHLSAGVTAMSPASFENALAGLANPAAAVAPAFEDTETGTRALQAFFFGTASAGAQTTNSSGLSVPSFTPDAPTADTSATSVHPVAAGFSDKYPGGKPSPPILAYERSNPLIQPRPQPTQQQTNLMRALLGQSSAVASPPPQTDSYSGVRRDLGGYGSQQPSAPPSAPPHLSELFRSLQIAKAEDEASSRGASPGESMLFAHSKPPREAEGFGTTRLPTENERSERERREKHDALLRALDSLPHVDPTAHDFPPREDDLIPPTGGREGSGSSGPWRDTISSLFSRANDTASNQFEDQSAIDLRFLSPALVKGPDRPPSLSPDFLALLGPNQLASLPEVNAGRDLLEEASSSSRSSRNRRNKQVENPLPLPGDPSPAMGQSQSPRRAVGQQQQQGGQPQGMAPSALPSQQQQQYQQHSPHHQPLLYETSQAMPPPPPPPHGQQQHLPQMSTQGPPGPYYNTFPSQPSSFSGPPALGYPSQQQPSQYPPMSGFPPQQSIPLQQQQFYPPGAFVTYQGFAPGSQPPPPPMFLPMQARGGMVGMPGQWMYPPPPPPAQQGYTGPASPPAPPQRVGQYDSGMIPPGGAGGGGRPQMYGPPLPMGSPPRITANAQTAQLMSLFNKP